MRFILSWFAVHQSLLHSWGDISVLLFFSQCSWGFSSVPSGKSRFLTSLIGNMELLSMKYRGISVILRRVGSLISFLELRRGWPFETRVCSAKSGLLSSYDSHLGKLIYAWQKNYRRFWRWARKPSVPYYLAQLYWYSYQFSPRGRHCHLLKHWTQCTSWSLKWMWGHLPRRGW